MLPLLLNYHIPSPSRPNYISMGSKTDIATRAIIVTLKSPLGERSTNQIADLTGLNPRTINAIYAKAIQRRFDPYRYPITIKDAYIEDGYRPGRPTKQTEAFKDLLTSKVRIDRFGRELSYADLVGYLSANGQECSIQTVSTYLKKLKFRKTKPTRKPGLTKKMKDEYLSWYLYHQDWTLEDWKNVIWSDKTSVILCQRRGGYRIWRIAKEAYIKSAIRERWKGYSEFMFWAYFTYNTKGPQYSYIPETAQ